MTTDQETGRFIVEQSQKILELTKRAEAAELALQTQIENWQKRIYETCKKVYPEVDGGGCDSGDELDFSITEIEQTFAHLQAALQAKEQDAATWRRVAEKLETEKAQARQQAVAETREECAKIAETEHERYAVGPQDTSGPNYHVQKAGYAIAAEIRYLNRSLTPPPALTLDVNRCAVCGWPLSETAEKGCARGNCSLRPRPANLYDPERAEVERVAPPSQKEK